MARAHPIWCLLLLVPASGLTGCSSSSGAAAPAPPPPGRFINEAPTSVGRQPVAARPTTPQQPPPAGVPAVRQPGMTYVGGPLATQQPPPPQGGALPPYTPPPRAPSPNVMPPNPMPPGSVPGSMTPPPPGGAAAMPGTQPAPRFAPSGLVLGQVMASGPMALPAGTVVTVRLLDVTRGAAGAPALAEQSIPNPGRLPTPFQLRYDPSRIDQRGSYAVRARVTAGGRLLYVTTTSHTVITRGRPSSIDVRVEPTR